MRDKIFAALPTEWHVAYEAGVFTEFMEQRAPGHTVLDDKIYRRGLLDFKAEIAHARTLADPLTDPEGLPQARAAGRRWRSPATRSSDLPSDTRSGRVQLAETEDNPQRRAELQKIADVCTHVPAHAPRDFHEALQAYWFCHLAVITELNGWDAFSPGHLDQHLWPFYQRGIADGTLTRDTAKELLEAFFVKFNNHTAPPKVGVTAEESGTYTDFANINLGGLLARRCRRFQRSHPPAVGNHRRNAPVAAEQQSAAFPKNTGCDAETRATRDRQRLRFSLDLQRRCGGGRADSPGQDPGGCPRRRMQRMCRDRRIRQGSVHSDRLLQPPKVLELALHDGLDPRTGRQVGPHTGNPADWQSFDQLFNAFRDQLSHLVDIKIRGNQLIEQMYANLMPAPFLSVITDDCIRQGKDYNAGGARYNHTFIQFVGIGSLTDSLVATKQLVFDEAGIDAFGSDRNP